MTKYNVKYYVCGYASETIDTDESEEDLYTRLEHEGDDNILDRLDTSELSIDEIDVQKMYLYEKENGDRYWSTSDRHTDKRID